MYVLISRDKFVCERFSSALGAGFKVFDSYKSMLSGYSIQSGDVVVVDIESIEAFDLTKVGCAVAVFVGIPKYEEAMRLLRFGIRGYGNRLMLPVNIAQVVNSLANGQVWMPPDVISRMISNIPVNEKESDSSADMSELTDREIEVARLVADGLTNKEIAEKADITVRTVKAHLTSIFNKTGLRDRVALALSIKSDSHIKG